MASLPEPLVHLFVPLKAKRVLGTPVDDGHNDGNDGDNVMLALMLTSMVMK